MPHLPTHPPLTRDIQNERPTPNPVDQPRALSDAERDLLAAAQRSLIERRQQDRQQRTAAAQHEASRPAMPPLVPEPEQGPELPAPPPLKLPAPPPPRQRQRRAWYAGLKMDERATQTHTAAQQAEAKAKAARPLMQEQLRATEGRTPRRDRLDRNLTVYQALVEAVFTVAAAREQRADLVHSYTFFTVLDCLSTCTGLSTRACERATADLRTLGWIDTHQYITSSEFLNRETGELVNKRVCAGTWVCVVLKPEQQQQRARVRLSELEWEDGQLKAPRDLSADRKAGRTAYQLNQEEKEVSESYPCEGGSLFVTSVLTKWTLNIDLDQSVFTDTDTSHRGRAGRLRDIVWELRHRVSVRPQYRAEAIEQTAGQLAAYLSDGHSQRHYMRILWRAVNAEMTGRAGFAPLEAALLRAAIAAEEGGIQRPGAYLTHLLQTEGWWNNVYRA